MLDHGRTCGCSGTPTSWRPESRVCARVQETASSTKASVVQRSLGIDDLPRGRLVRMPTILKINDAAWLYAETYRTPMQVGMLATFTMPEDADECYLEDMVTRWREVRTFQPPF